MAKDKSKRKLNLIKNAKKNEQAAPELKFSQDTRIKSFLLGSFLDFLNKH